MDLLNLLRLQWDRAIAVIAGVVGLIALVLGYFGSSGTPHVAEQLPYFISGGLFGIFSLAVAATAWISADLRDEWRELRAVRGLLEDELRSRGVGAPTSVADRLLAEPSPEAAVASESKIARNGTPRRPRKLAAAASAEQ